VYNRILKIPVKFGFLGLSVWLLIFSTTKGAAMNTDRRIYGTVKDITREELVAAFASCDGILIAVLFGSRSSGKFVAKSDYDFAVVMDKNLPAPWGHLGQARNEIGQLLQLPDGDFDMVDLDTAPVALRRSIREDFILLKGDQSELFRILDKYADNGGDREGSS
jgi:predicted nucleotidyltransferase